MALGKAIITITIGSEGIALHHDQSALYADDTAAFANAVVSLLDDPTLRARLGAAARGTAEPRNRGTAEQHYGWDAHGDDLLRHYQRLLTDLPAPGDCPAEGTATART